MTKSQAEQIKEMRLNGIGYRTIGNTIGLSRDVVRNFCKTRGLSGYGKSEAYRKYAPEGKCKYCFKDIGQAITGRPRKFCSETCRRKWWAAHPDSIHRQESAFYKLICQYCGKEFISYGNRERKFCNQECYIRNRFFSE